MTRTFIALNLVLLALILLAARPLWSSPDFLLSDDGMLHVFRTYNLDQTLRQGTVYPRWSPDLGYGLGDPVLNYYPPLASYLTETWHLFGLSFEAAVAI